MCLNCKNLINIVNDKEQLKKIFKFTSNKYLHTHNNCLLKLNNKQLKEIEENAIVVVITSVDLSCDIWAIQWPNTYATKTL
jgi:hypothetical protein